MPRKFYMYVHWSIIHNENDLILHLRRRRWEDHWLGNWDLKYKFVSSKQILYCRQCYISSNVVCTAKIIGKVIGAELIENARLQNIKFQMAKWAKSNVIQSLAK